MFFCCNSQALLSSVLGLDFPQTKTRGFSARLDLPAVPCCGQVAAGHVRYSAQSRSRGGSRQGWQLFSFAIPPMSCTSLSHREQEWEHGKEKDRWNFLTPTGGEARAECQMPQKTTFCMVYFLKSLERAISFLSPWEGAWSKRSKNLRTQTKHSNEQERWGLTIFGLNVGFLGKRKLETVYQFTMPAHTHCFLHCAFVIISSFLHFSPWHSPLPVCSSNPLFHKIFAFHFLEAKWPWLGCPSSQYETVVSPDNFRTMIWVSHY